MYVSGRRRGADSGSATKYSDNHEGLVVDPAPTKARRSTERFNSNADRTAAVVGAQFAQQPDEG